MIRNAVANTMQNKNTVMFITAIIFMIGILAYFNDIAIISAFLLTILAVFLIIKNYFWNTEEQGEKLCILYRTARKSVVIMNVKKA